MGASVSRKTFNELEVTFKWISSPDADLDNPPKVEPHTMGTYFGDRLSEAQRMSHNRALMQYPISSAIQPGGRQRYSMLKLHHHLLANSDANYPLCNQHLFKLETYEKNHIEGLFLDRRIQYRYMSDDILVICCDDLLCEYQIRIMDTLLTRSYSIIAWNYPRRGYSTGDLTLTAVVSAVDTVMKYAIEVLKFPVENIVVFGYCLGTWTASWVAKHYPHIRGLVLDTPYDNFNRLFELKSNQFTSILNLWTRIYDMDLLKLLEGTETPVIVIRRLRDQVMNGNQLTLKTHGVDTFILKLLESRFPYISKNLNIVKEYLSVSKSAQQDIIKSHHIDYNECVTLLANYLHVNGTQKYPVRIGSRLSDITPDQKTKLVLFLVSHL